MVLPTSRRVSRGVLRNRNECRTQVSSSSPTPSHPPGNGVRTLRRRKVRVGRRGSPLVSGSPGTRFFVQKVYRRCRRWAGRSGFHPVVTSGWRMDLPSFVTSLRWGVGPRYPVDVTRSVAPATKCVSTVTSFLLTESTGPSSSHEFRWTEF